MDALVDESGGFAKRCWRTPWPPGHLRSFSDGARFMVEAFLLDSLLVIVIGLLGLMGLWRGPVRELLVSVGILAGAQLAAAWAFDIGDRVAGSVDMRLSSAMFLSAIVLLTIVTVLIGYGAALLVADRDLVVRSRIAGLAIGVGNGLLLVAFSIQLYQRFLLPDQQSDLVGDTRLADFINNEFRFVILAYALVVGLVVLFGRVVASRGVEEPVLPPVNATSTLAAPPRRDPLERGRPVPVPRSADGGKIEPAANTQDRVTSTNAEHTTPYTPAADSPLLVGGAAKPAESPWATRANPAPGNAEEDVDAFTLWSLGYAERIHREDDEPARENTRQSQSQIAHEAPSDHGTADGTSEQEAARFAATDTGPAASARATCESCGWEMASDDRFCPNCGRGAEERNDM